MPKIKFKKLFAAMLFAVTVVPLSAHANSEHDAALAEANNGHYAMALSYYRIAAEQGDRAAQRIAGLMLYYGERLYGEEIHQDLPAAKIFLSMAAAQGCEVSKFMLGKLAAR